MTQNIHSVANFFLSKVEQEAGENITHLKLQKIVYYAQAWYLALYGKPLVDDAFEAWAHGPVASPLYGRFKGSSWDPIWLTEDDKIDLPEDVIKHCEEVWKVYGQFTAKKLEELTHNETPWIEMRKGLGPLDRCTNVITQDAMKNYYSKRVKRHGKR